MAKKKQIIEESFNKMKTLLESRLSEAPSAAPAAPAAQPAAASPAQPAAQPDPAVQQKSNAMDAEMDKAMKIAVGNIDDVLKKFVATQGDKDGVIDAPDLPKTGEKTGEKPSQDNQAGQTDQAGQAGQAQGQTGKQVMESEGGQGYLVINESLLEEELQQEAIGMAIAGAVLSAPTITTWMGKGVSALGKKVDSKYIRWAGQKMAKFGKKWHHAYINTIAMAVAGVMQPKGDGTPAHYKDKDVQKIAKVIFMAIVAAMGVGAASGATHAAAHGHSALAAVEGGLAGVKGTETAGELLKGIAPILKSMGIG